MRRAFAPIWSHGQTGGGQMWPRGGGGTGCVGRERGRLTDGEKRNRRFVYVGNISREVE